MAQKPPISPSARDRALSMQRRLTVGAGAAARLVTAGLGDRLHGRLVEANIGATAAVMIGGSALPWLEVDGLDARLVAIDGSVIRSGRWSADRPAEPVTVSQGGAADDKPVKEPEVMRRLPTPGRCGLPDVQRVEAIVDESACTRASVMALRLERMEPAIRSGRGT